MLVKVRRAAIVVWLLILLMTGGLYLFANFETVAEFSKELTSPIFMAVQEAFAKPTEPEPDPHSETVPPRVPAFDGEDTPPAEASPVVSTNISDLPYFTHESMLKLVPKEVERIIYMLGEDTWANLWLVERAADGRWHNAAGPLICRIGSGGLGSDKIDGDCVTPIGWLIPSYLYSVAPYEAEWPVRTMRAGDMVWVTDPLAERYNAASLLSMGGFDSFMRFDVDTLYLDLGYNRARTAGRGSGVFLHGAEDLESPTEGSVAVKQADMERIASWLDVSKYTVIGMFRAEAASWEVYTGLPDGFLFLSEGVPGARQDARYAGNDNFLGRPIDGYEGAHVVVSGEMAAALLKVQQKLEQDGLGLLVYDAYRPQRAVDDIFRWLSNDEPGRQEDYYPKLDKAKLAGRYLSEYSLHRYGAAVDLTICDLETGEPLDMGTGFDFFSFRSAYGAKGITDEQAANRKLLRDIMREHGFTAYDSEWWHFNLLSVASQGKVYDFVIPQ